MTQEDLQGQVNELKEKYLKGEIKFSEYYPKAKKLEHMIRTGQAQL